MPHIAPILHWHLSQGSDNTHRRTCDLLSETIQWRLLLDMWKVQNGPRILYESINRGHFFPIFQISSNPKNAYLAPPRDIKYFWLVENHEESATYLQFIIRRSLHLQKSWTCCFKIVLINHIIFLSSNSQVQNHLHPLSEAKLRQGITRHFKPTLPDTCHKSLTLPCFSPVLPTASWDLRRGLHVGPAEARRPAGDHPHQEGGFPHTDPVLLLHGEVRMINTQRLYPQSSHSQGSFYSRYRVENTIFMSCSIGTACSWQCAPWRTQTESRRWLCWTRSKQRRGTTSWDSPRCSSFGTWGFFAGLGVYVCVFGKVFIKELLYQQLEEKWSTTQTWAAITIQRNIRGFLCRRNFKFFRQKAIVIQSHIRGHQARYIKKGG